MKKFAFVILATLLAASAVLAQESDDAERPHCGRHERHRGERAEQPRPQLVTVEGALLLRDGQIALVTVEDAAYYIPGLWRYAGFIDGLKEGAHVFITGHIFGEFLRPSRLVLGGKTYDLAAVGSPKSGERGRRHDPHGSMRQGERGRGHGYHGRHEPPRCPRQGEDRPRPNCPRQAGEPEPKTEEL